MKPTAAQSALFHVAESAASSAVFTLIVGIMQQLATHQINVVELGTIFGGGFVACCGLVYKSVKADPNLPQAEADTAVEARSLAQQALDRIENMWPVLHAHSNAIAAQKAATPASVPQPPQPSPPFVVSSSGIPSVPQMPFPSMIAGTQIFPNSGAAYPQTYTINATLPSAQSSTQAQALPPRSWTDTALTQAVTPQPPRG